MSANNLRSRIGEQAAWDYYRKLEINGVRKSANVSRDPVTGRFCEASRDGVDTDDEIAEFIPICDLDAYDEWRDEVETDSDCADDEQNDDETDESDSDCANDLDEDEDWELASMSEYLWSQTHEEEKLWADLIEAGLNGDEYAIDLEPDCRGDEIEETHETANPLASSMSRKVKGARRNKTHRSLTSVRCRRKSRVARGKDPWSIWVRASKSWAKHPNRLPVVGVTAVDENAPIPAIDEWTIAGWLAPYRLDTFESSMDDDQIETIDEDMAFVERLADDLDEDEQDAYLFWYLCAGREERPPIRFRPMEQFADLDLWSIPDFDENEDVDNVDTGVYLFEHTGMTTVPDGYEWYDEPDEECVRLFEERDGADLPPHEDIYDDEPIVTVAIDDPFDDLHDLQEELERTKPSKVRRQSRATDVSVAC